MKKIHLIFTLLIAFCCINAKGQYCAISFSSTSDYIREVVFGSGSGANGWTNTTNAISTNGYGNFSNNPAYRATVEPGKTYSMTVRVDGTGTQHVRIFIDWNGDGTFEYTANFGSQASGYNFTGNIVVPTNATNKITRMRVVDEYNEAPTACQADTWGEAEDYSIEICDGTTQALSSVSVVQNTTAPASRTANNIEIIGFNVKVAGCASPLALRSATFGKGDSDNLSADATGAQLYYTGSNSNFATTTLVGSSAAPGNTFTLNNIEASLSKLSDGDNWFWLTYDIPAGATLDNYVDAELISLNIAGTTQAVSNGDPAGKRLIVNTYCTPTPANQAGAAINGVTIGSLSNTGTGNNLYRSYVASLSSFDLCTGNEEDLVVAWSSNTTYIDGQVPLFVHAYFDWDRNGQFDGANEHYFLGDALSGAFSPVTVNGQPIGGGPTSGTMTGNIKVPQSAKPGASVMRVVISRDATADPCLGTVDGETEDYGYMLSKAGELKVAGDNSFVCDKDSVQLLATNASAGFIYQSSIDGVNWSDIPGSTDKASLYSDIIDTTIYFRLKHTNAACASGEAYSDVLDLGFVGINQILNSKSQICSPDTADLEALFEYPTQQFSETFGETLLGGATAEFEIPVTGLSTTYLNDVALESVCITGGATAGADGTFLVLYAPNSNNEKRILLNAGRGTDNTPGSPTTACYSMHAADPIKGHTGALDGSFRPEESFDRFQGVDPNGTWTLMVFNRYVDGLTELEEVTLNFGTNDGAVTWTPATDISSTTTPATRVYPSVSTEYFASITNNFCTANDSLDITVLGGNPITVSIDGVTPTGTVCEGTSMTFTASLSEAIANPPVQWFVNNVAVPGATSLAFTSSTLQNGDVVKIEFNLTTQCGNFFSSDFQGVNIDANVTPTLALNTNTSFPVCAGAPVQFSAIANDFGPSPTYEWFVNGNSVQQGGVTYNGNNLVDGDVVKVVVSTTYPCASVSSLEEELTYRSTTELDPDIILSSDVNPDLSCLGKMISFSVDTAINNSGGRGSLRWILDGIVLNISGTSTQTDTISSGQHFMRVEYIVNSSCTKANFVSDQISFEVGEDVVPTISFTSSASQVCKGDSVFFEVTNITNGGSNPKLQWFKNSAPIPGATGMTYADKNFQNQDEINVRLESSIECVSFEQSFADEAVIVKISDRTPTEVNIASDFEADPFCDGTNVRIDIDYQLGGGVKPIFEWYVNNKRVQKNALEYLLIDSLKTGDKVYAKMLPNSVCATPAVPVSDTLSFTVNPIPFVDYQAVQNGNDIEFTPNRNDFVRYTWEFGTGETSIQTTPVYQYNGEGLYNTCLTIEDENGCVNKKCKKVQYTPVTTGINSLSSNENLKLYPNPSSGVFYLEGAAANADYQLVSIDGKIINLLGSIEKTGTNQVKIDLSRLAKGVYQLQVVEEESRSVVRLELR